MRSIQTIIALLCLSFLLSSCRTTKVDAPLAQLKAIQDEVHILTLKQQAESALFGFEICLTNDQESGSMPGSCIDAFYDGSDKPLRFDFYTVMFEDLSEEQLESLSDLSKLQAKYEKSSQGKALKRSMGTALILAGLIQSTYTWLGPVKNKLPTKVGNSAIGILLWANGVLVLFAANEDGEKAEKASKEIDKQSGTLTGEFFKGNDRLPVLLEYWRDIMDPVSQAGARKLSADDDVSVKELTKILAKQVTNLAWVDKESQPAKYCWPSLKKYQAQWKNGSTEGDVDSKKIQQCSTLP